MLLSPHDERDMPVPGFPSGDAVIAWARAQSANEVIEAASAMINGGEWPRQYMLMALLRALGVKVEYTERVGLEPLWRVTRA